MTTASRHFFASGLAEADLASLAQLLALKARPADCIALHGDLGAGKTTFARAFIRAMLDDPDAEVPSPTFAITQTYPDARIPILHFDWYRLTAAEELDEIGFEHGPSGDAITPGEPVTLIEWPDRAEHRLPDRVIEVGLEEDADTFERRDVTIRAIEPDGEHVVADRIARIQSLWAARNRAAEISGARPLRIDHLKGDASTRSYARIIFACAPSLILMDSPASPDGPSEGTIPAYSAVARLAETVDPFIAIAAHLHALGLSAPDIVYCDRDAGVLLIEDLGEAVFDRVHTVDTTVMAERWEAAVDVLVELRANGPAPETVSGPGVTHSLPRFDTPVMLAEVSLFLDWAWPAIHEREAGQDERATFLTIWRDILKPVSAETDGLVLRDYHSPNLIWCADREGVRRVGLIDFQDALRGSWAYDLVSLLQDARVDVAPALHDRLFEHYCATVAARTPTFDRDAFATTYAALGAQRAMKIIGIFHRLHRRDGKPAYLRHLPRVRSYLDRNLAHPSLAPLRTWYEANFKRQAT